jgi:hypothetical protein
MTNKNAQRKRRKQVPVHWVPEQDFDVAATARPPEDPRPWSPYSLFIHLSEGDTTRVVRPPAQS